jgi:hypothetical protein
VLPGGATVGSPWCEVEPQTGAMTAVPSEDSAARGVLRLLNTAGGRVLCLAGTVDDEVVGAFRRRYGPEPVRIDGLDAGSVTNLSPRALELVLEHLAAAERAGRRVAISRSAVVEPLLDGGTAGTPTLDRA